jgi:hypothetical protein
VKDIAGEDLMKLGAYKAAWLWGPQRGGKMGGERERERERQRRLRQISRVEMMVTSVLVSTVRLYAIGLTALHCR